MRRGAWWRMRRGAWWRGVTALAVATLAWFGLDGNGTAAQAESEVGVRPLVRSAAVRITNGETRYRFPGTVRASERAVPAFLHPGVLRERHVIRGQRVEQGEALATLHNPAMAPARAAADAQVAELDARLRQLGRDVERSRTLRERNLSAVEELDRLTAERDATVQAREQALARRAEAQAQLEELTLRAPFDAEVADLLVEPGEFVSAGQPVLRLAGIGRREVEIDVPAALAGRLETGGAASLIATDSAQRFAGSVRDIGRAGEGLASVIVGVDTDPGPALGESVRVQLAVDERPALQVPLAAVVDPGGYDPHVLVLNDDIVQRVAITPGRLAGSWVTITAPLEPGAQVVTAGQGRLEEGMRVRVLP
ncbi:efflux RND transporter periplasmic adaptor subunit [Billgrantia pellis]|uniref:Efflux RND transporter periplasmic adaptor subunit n=1 Tax=Billgrantia pellis TaxID=2606936 RepID=A0A7V7FZD1_9GAMM|nr:efflux RND transporter periplasmic adaptor subunit [Halomonas pellis]KAA0011262.1 efflux RND transporter periplasmic adaptor subunit [Halomonas pellis]